MVIEDSFGNVSEMDEQQIHAIYVMMDIHGMRINRDV